MTVNKPIKQAPTPENAVESVSSEATSGSSASTITTKSNSKKVENKGIISKIKSFFRM